MKNHFKQMFILLGFLLLSTISIYSGTVFAEIVIKTGVANPQAGEKSSNIEKLRKRAIRNAMEMAQMQITGAVITSDRGGLSAHRDVITSSSGDVDEQQKQVSTFHLGSKTKTTGNVKVLDVIKEWQEGEQYFVTLKMDVATEQDLLKSNNVGTLWERIDKPSIGIKVSLNRNNQRGLQGTSLQNYLEDNLSRNDVDVSSANLDTERFSIEVSQRLKNELFAEMATYKTNCELSFAIIDNDIKRSVSDYRISHGPDAGFSEKESEERCTKAIARSFSEKLLKEIAIIFNNEWNNGKDFIVSVVALPGQYATQSSDLIANAYLVTSGEIRGFNDGRLTMNVTYQGKGLELADAVTTAFFEAGIRIDLKSMNGNQVEFSWLGIEDN